MSAHGVLSASSLARVPSHCRAGENADAFASLGDGIKDIAYAFAFVGRELAKAALDSHFRKGT